MCTMCKSIILFPEAQGLLKHFINEKLAKYDEPVRKGTPKGMPIGFSNKKYGACLLSLTKIPIKEQSNIVNTSYYVLTKWRTMDRFRELAGELSYEYAKFFFETINRKYTKEVSSPPIKYHNWELPSEIEKKKENVIAKKDKPLVEKNLHGELALNAIFEKLIQELKYGEKINARVLEEYILPLDIPTTFSKEKIFSEVRNVLIERCQKNLTQIPHNPEKIIEAYEILNFLRSFLDKLYEESGERKYKNVID